MAVLTDQQRADVEALIAAVDAIDQALVDDSYDVPSPDPTTEPTEADVEAASATVVALELRQNTLRAATAEWRGRSASMAYFAGVYHATDWLYQIAGTNGADRAAVDGIIAERDLLAELVARFERVDAFVQDLTAAEQLTTQLLDHWRSALAVLEHDIKWQAYVAAEFGATENPRRQSVTPLLHRERPAAGTAVARDHERAA